MYAFDLRWKKDKKWLTYDELGMRVPREDAPDYVKESYENYLRQNEEVLRREREEGVIIA